MENINYSDKIKSLRKAKGLTQQQLANETGLSLRTIQRVEKGTEEISGYSLNQISKVLNIPLEQIIMQNVNQISIDNNQIGSVRNLYLSSLFFIFNPTLGLLVPYIIGKSKQNSSAFYNIHLRKIIRFHGFYNLTLIIIFLLFITITFFISRQYQSLFFPINSLFIWQLLILTYMIYIPVSAIWTLIAFKKITMPNLV